MIGILIYLGCMAALIVLGLVVVNLGCQSEIDDKRSAASLRAVDEAAIDRICERLDERNARERSRENHVIFTLHRPEGDAP